MKDSTTSSREKVQILDIISSDKRMVTYANQPVIQAKAWYYSLLDLLGLEKH